jgi:hypothetical protein
MNSKSDQKGYAARSFFQQSSIRYEVRSELVKVSSDGQQVFPGEPRIKLYLDGIEHEL